MWCRRFKRSKLLTEYNAALPDFNRRNPDQVPVPYAKVKEHALLHPPVVYNKHTDVVDGVYCRRCACCHCCEGSPHVRVLCCVVSCCVVQC
jgi:hypothetical protein